ncbi:MAG: hypothetical protein ABJC66_02425 [Gammaproteobacteria bacterium]
MKNLPSQFVRVARELGPPRMLIVACGIVMLAACAAARVPPLVAGAAQVEKITAEEGLACKYLRNVAFVAKLKGIGKSYEVLHQAGENGLRNAVAGIGGNAFVDTRMDADGWGRIDYSGQAFQCSKQVAASYGFTGRSWH